MSWFNVQCSAKLTRVIVFILSTDRVLICVQEYLDYIQKQSNASCTIVCIILRYKLVFICPDINCFVLFNTCKRNYILCLWLSSFSFYIVTSTLLVSSIFWSLYCISLFYLRLLITPLISSNCQPLHVLSFFDKWIVITPFVSSKLPYDAKGNIHKYRKRYFGR